MNAGRTFPSKSNRFLLLAVTLCLLCICWLGWGSANRQATTADHLTPSMTPEIWPVAGPGNDHGNG